MTGSSPHKPYRHKRSAADVVAARADAVGAPFGAMVEIADRCNEACVHCYQVQGQKGELGTEEWKRIFDELASMGVMFLTISGGEPTLRKDFLELVAHARGLRFAVKIYSNALNIDEELARKLGELAVQEVQISFYSHRPEVHDQVTRVRGSHEKVIRATKLLRAAGVKVLLKTPLFDVNAAEFAEYVDLVTSLDAHYAVDPHLSPREDGDLSPLALRATKRDYFAIKRDPNFRVPDPPKPEELEARGKKTSKPCGACKGYMHIEANGELRPCTQWSVATGQASREGVRAAWEANPVADVIRNLTWQDLPLCRDCDLQHYCGRCFADAERLGGDALAPYASACRRARWQYELLNGVEPEIDGADANHCPRDPVGPFTRAGEHRFITPTNTSQAPDASAPNHDRAWLRERSAQADLGSAQLVQLRRRQSGPVVQLTRQSSAPEL